jgi:hypothetical protein
MRLTMLAMPMVLALALGPPMAGATPDAGRAAHERELGAESPEMVLARAQEAFRKNDLYELGACLSREVLVDGVHELIASIAIYAAFSAMAEEADQEARDAAMTEKLAPLERLLLRHGLPRITDHAPEDTEVMIDEFLARLDQVSLFMLLAGLVDVTPTVTRSTVAASRIVPNLEGELVDLEIEGETASASLAGQPIRFVQVHGRWFIGKADDEDQGSDGW